MYWVDKFWSHADKRGDDECWEWKGNRLSSGGYGRMNTGGKDERAHRISYMLAYGPFDPKLFVRHKCDNPPCVNPNHLILGTHQDNMNDMAERGRRKLSHCSNGHEYTEENTETLKNGTRRCKACRKKSRERDKVKYKEKRGDKFGKPEYRVRTHCPSGHEYVEGNIYINKQGYKQCRECRAKRVKAFRSKA